MKMVFISIVIGPLTIQQTSELLASFNRIGKIIVINITHTDYIFPQVYF